ncbi:LOW QUALITY PROTEIN: uncharacterized protein C19orf73 homolog [Thomomys bottae]
MGIKVGFGQGGSRKDALLEGGVRAWVSAPPSAPLRPPGELHAASPPTPTQTVVRPTGLPRRTWLMVRSAPPTRRPPTGPSRDWGLPVRPASAEAAAPPRRPREERASSRPHPRPPRPGVPASALQRVGSGCKLSSSRPSPRLRTL